jgi:hypothetical protein
MATAVTPARTLLLFPFVFLLCAYLSLFIEHTLLFLLPRVNLIAQSFMVTYHNSLISTSLQKLQDLPSILKRYLTFLDARYAKALDDKLS